MEGSKEHVFICPVCGRVESRKQHGGVMCDKCHVFMIQKISATAFEDYDAETEENYG